MTGLDLVEKYGQHVVRQYLVETACSNANESGKRVDLSLIEAAISTKLGPAMRPMTDALGALIDQYIKTDQENQAANRPVACPCVSDEWHPIGDHLTVEDVDACIYGWLNLTKD